MPSDLQRATRILMRRDPVLRAIAKRVGECSVVPCAARARFETLVRAIVFQQLSGRAAETIWRRLRERVRGRPTCPRHILAVRQSTLRKCGLSERKASSVLDLARACDHGLVDLAAVGRLDDEEVIEMLTSVRGIGRWTAEMFLIFALARPDVLPVGDLGVRKAAQRIYGLRQLPDAEQLTRLAVKWRPYRTVASWLLWRNEGEADLPR